MKLVKVQDLFEVKYGVNLDLNKLEEVSVNFPEAIPYVGRSEKQNGVTAFVEKINGVPPNPAMTISVAGGGSVMSSFLQEFPYYSGRDLFYLKPKIPMSKQVLLYYCTALTMNKFKFSYGRQVNRTLGELLIPDISEIPNEILNYSIDDSLGIRQFELLNNKVSSVGNLLAGINESNFKMLQDIFNMHNGLASSNVLVQPEKANEFLIPYVRPSKWQSTSYAGYVDIRTIPKNKVFPAGTLYVSTDGAGSHTYSYVSVEPFVPNSNVTVLIPKKDFSLEKKLAYATLITANRYKFSYGRKPKGNKLKVILLPDL
ncbi:restriction endonuclease subunit S [Oceanobacillus sp. ISL-73]|uniref:restriction endonuclease subunit S n=1 Tax=Oceanobacillus sp. ISL-73 TaxID=2819161 RepID=UPI001BE6B834|nr:restriction endonuclease subunit S [Oceanobacillus sp. ISL-73]MBT2652753.1 restriction endonuclease subunit S [Oceanobacillus sp. ISL-73]